MIKRIKNIHYKSFNNLKASNISFDRFNLVFGLNGRGKSSLCQFLQESYKNSTLESFEISGGECELFAYDEQYRRDVLYIDQDDKNLDCFYGGDGIEKIVKEEKLLNSKLDKLQKLRIKIEAKALKSEKELGDLKSAIAKTTRAVLVGIDASYNKSSLYQKNHITDNLFHLSKPLSDEELIHKQKYSIHNIPQRISLFSFNQITKLRSGEMHLHVVLKATPANQAIQRLKQDPSLEEIARMGLELKKQHPQYENICPLCEQNVGQIRLWEQLEGHFNKEYEELVGRVANAIAYFKQCKEELQSFLSWLEENFISTKLLLEGSEDIDLVRKKYRDIAKTLILKIEDWLVLLENKRQNPNQAITLPEDSMNIKNQIDEVHHHKIIADIIHRHNTLQSQYTQTIKENIQAIKSHFIAKEAKQYKKIKWNIDLFHSQIAKLDLISTCFERSKEEIHKKLKELDQSFLMLNQDMKDWFFDGIRFEKISDAYYKIQRLGHNGEWFDCKSGLSEGEKTIVSVVYFVNRCLIALKQSKNPIILIDDPITSLDSQNKEAIVNYIAEKIVKDYEGQLFVFSHDEDVLRNFYCGILDINKEYKKTTQTLQIHKKGQASFIAQSEPFEHGESIQTYETRLQKFVKFSNIQEAHNIMNDIRKMLEKIFIVYFDDYNPRQDFRKSYDSLLETLKLAKKYSHNQIHELNHSPTDTQLMAEVENKAKFALKILAGFRGLGKTKE